MKYAYALLTLNSLVSIFTVVLTLMGIGFTTISKKRKV